MFKLALRSARSHLGRLVLTALSVALAVSFWSGTSITSATFSKTFNGLVTDVYSGIDFVVRPAEGFSTFGFVDDEKPLPEATLAAIRATPGVAVAEPYVYEEVTLASATGVKFDEGGSFESWMNDADIRPYQLADGRAPTDANEVALDRGTIQREKLSIGDTTRITRPDGTTLAATVVGVVTYANSDSLPGESTVIGELSWVRESIDQQEGYNRIWLSTTEPENPLVASQLATALGSDIEVVSGTKLREDTKSEFATIVNVLKAVLSGFAVIALLVGSFLIANTFSMLVTQRSREIALLRAIGASMRQVRRSVLLEAAVVGFVAALAGLAIGIGIAKGLIGLLKTTGLDVELAPLVVSPSTVISALLLGVAATVGAAWLPIRKATKVPPIAALRANAVETVGRVSVRRIVLGIIPLVAGIGLIVAGSLGDASLTTVGPGAGLLVLGSLLLSPVIARPALAAIARLVPGRGTVAQLANENVRRNPRRSAATANALLIGLALVTGFTVVGASIQESIAGGSRRQFAGAEGYIESFESGIDDAVKDKIAASPGVNQVGGSVFAAFKQRGSLTSVSGIDTNLDGVVDLGLRDGVKLTDLGANELFVYKNQYKDGLRIGDQVPVEFAETGAQVFTVAGIFDNNSAFADYVISMDTYRENFNRRSVDWMLVDADSEAQAIAASKAATASIDALVRTVDQQEKAVRKQVDQLLAVIIGLLALTLVIALMGIINTMALSVLERTREIGLLRAVGMARAQVRSTIRREAVMITIYGVGFGVVLGLIIGWASVGAMASLGVDRVAFAPGRLVGYAAVGIVAGIAAAALPARRSARLNILEAVSVSA